ncbi:hypothetical protein KI387_012368 [Taxus chinensis]|uniref:Transcription factor PosF21 n=1 Tax=Taxus chinensis TaxID=29808 RepID=A0AA38CI09_TAXCH|nr:hypothetical protein KI387_012368 [Taxus chinensis]
MRYISELERKVQTLQTEATTLSAQLTMLQVHPYSCTKSSRSEETTKKWNSLLYLIIKYQVYNCCRICQGTNVLLSVSLMFDIFCGQRDTNGLTTENNELKLRLQSMEQQVHLRDALNDALREEVHRLKLATGQMANGGHVMNFGTSSFGHSQQYFQVQRQPSHTLLAAHQLQQLHLQSQQSGMEMWNGGTASSQGLRDSLSDFSMTSEGLPVNTSQEAGCNF